MMELTIGRKGKAQFGAIKLNHQLLKGARAVNPCLHTLHVSLQRIYYLLITHVFNVT